MNRFNMTAICLMVYMSGAAAMAPLQITDVVVQPVGCTGGNNGTITVTGSGGSAKDNYLFTLTSGGLLLEMRGAATVTFISLPADSYTIRLTDTTVPAATAATATATVTPALPLTVLNAGATATSTPVATDGSITVEVAGGQLPATGVINFVITPAPAGLTTTFPTPRTVQFANLPIGDYTVTANSADGCTPVVAELAVQGPLVNGGRPEIDAILVTPVGCAGGATGELAISAVSGGTPVPGTLMYAILEPIQRPEQTLNAFVNLPAGRYTVQVTDSSAPGLAAEATIDLGASLPLAIVEAQASAVACSDSTNGSLVVTTEGGQLPLTFVVDGGAPIVLPQRTLTLTGLDAGTHSVVVTSADDCPAQSFEVTIGVPAALVFTEPTIVRPTCFGLSNGSITLNVSGGVQPYSFTLNGGAPQVSPTFTGLAAGTYIATFNDADNCGPVSQTITLTQPAALSLALVPTQPTCNGLTDGTITATVAGGTAPITFSLNGQTVPSTGLTHVFTGLADGAYTVSVDDANECGPVTQTVTITQPTAVTITNITVTPANCAGVPTGSITILTSAPTVAVLQYTLSTGQTNQTGIFTGLEVGTYGIRVEAVPSQPGFCAVGSATVTATTTIVVSATATPAECLTGVLGSITATATGGVSPVEFSIDGVNFQPTGLFTNLAAGTYTVTARDVNGCIGTLSVTVGSIRGITGNPLTDFISRKYCSNAC